MPELLAPVQFGSRLPSSFTKITHGKPLSNSFDISTEGCSKSWTPWPLISRNLSSCGSTLTGPLYPKPDLFWFPLHWKERFKLRLNRGVLPQRTQRPQRRYRGSYSLSFLCALGVLCGSDLFSFRRRPVCDLGVLHGTTYLTCP